MHESSSHFRTQYLFKKMSKKQDHSILLTPHDKDVSDVRAIANKTVICVHLYLHLQLSFCDFLYDLVWIANAELDIQSSFSLEVDMCTTFVQCQQILSICYLQSFYPCKNHKHLWHGYHEHFFIFYFEIYRITSQLKDFVNDVKDAHAICHLER